MNRMNVFEVGDFEGRATWLLLVALTLSIGCSSEGSNRPKTYPVSGTVKLNGTAVEGATVTFQLTEGKENAIGFTDKSGKYSLSTFSPNDGAIAGQYKVSISKFEVDVAPKGAPSLPPGQMASGELPSDYAAPIPNNGGTRGATGPKNHLPAKFANADSSTLRALVETRGENKFDFDLK